MGQNSRLKRDLAKAIRRREEMARGFHVMRGALFQVTLAAEQAEGDVPWPLSDAIALARHTLGDYRQLPFEEMTK